MKLVREYIDFERGQDPKKSMGLGLMEKWKDLMKNRSLFRINKTFSTTHENQIKEGAKYNTFKEGDYLEINSPASSYEDGAIGFTAHVINDRVRSIDDFFIWGFPIQFEEHFQKVNKVGESLEFERGKNPKTSMEIGLSKKIANGLESLSKDPLVRQPLHVYGISSQDRGSNSSFPDNVNLYIELSAQEIPTEELMWDILEENGLDLIYFDSIWEDNQMWHVWRIMIDPEYDKNFKEAASMINESINFERGKDPKDSMKIGLDAQMEQKYGKKWKIFKRCNDISRVSYNFNWVSDIQLNEKDPYFNIESEFYYTDEDNNRYPLNYVIILYPDGIHAKEVIGENEEDIRSVNDFVEFTEAFEERSDWAGLFLESFGFKKENNPQKSLRIGKYKPEVKKFQTDGEVYEIEVIDNEFQLNDLDVRLDFKDSGDDEMDGIDSADVYVDGQKSDINLFKMSPFDYEFKEQGKYSDPGYTGYGFPIAKDENHLKELKEKHSYWYATSGDYDRQDKDPFVAAAKIILFTY
jgi:hypothetical protein